MATLTSRLIVALTDRVSGPARGIGAALGRLHRQGERTSGAMLGTAGAFGGGIVRGALAVGASYYGMSKAIGGTVGAAIKFEEKFADVRKVVDGTPAQLSAVRSEIIDLSKRLPVTAEGMADIFAAAGQSGVALNELGKFSEMAAKVSVAWDMAQGETGDALAKIKTQLQMSVSELGLHADAINHLANNTASAANDLVDFDKRVAAVGKMFGFTDTQTLAFGASMISAGAQSEVAATSFRNMGRALTMGERATKAQRTAYAKLGLDAVKTAKSMQKNALATTLDVMDRLSALPKWQQASIASALFGDEARGLLPVIADSRELRRELQMVGTEANYTGSAFQEYLVRSQTTANALTLIGNKIRAVGIGIGDSWLPTIKELGAGIGDVLDTLEKRVGVLDQVRFAFQGFMGGLGYGGTGGLREAVNDIGDLIFGKAFGGDLAQADDRVVGLARLSNRFRGIGADLKAFADNVAGGNIGDAIGNIGGAIQKMGGGLTVGGALAIAMTGRALIGLAQGATALALSKTGQIFLMAMAVSTLINAVKDAHSLGEFVENLKGLSALEWAGIGAGLLMVAGRAAKVVGWFRQLGRLAPTAATVAGGTAAAAGAATKGGGASVAGAGAKKSVGWFSRWLTGGGGAKDIVASGRASTEATLLEKLGLSAGRLGEATGIIGRAASRLLGLPAIAGEITTRALLATPPTDPRLADPSFAPWAYRRAEDRNAGRAQEPQQAAPPQANQPVPFSFSQMFRDLLAPVGSKDAGPSEVNVIGVPEVSIPAPVTTTPSGTQDVRVTNPMPAPVFNISISAPASDAKAMADAAVAALSAKWNALSRGAFSDGAN
ncbi:phage tail tape measure protein [Mesorhizobium sp. 8]|uniref:phage tail tape measure protein n=1 Tax=Mesorhizobium sp. 8 TaxID=2584466 RepID=UPI00111F23EB|nr:phage tail tape measure protein [Mesorhizobium sp. 8]QDC00377.1 phage tail tape measure protein [Mesorhizobium sp. 8]